MNSQTRGSRNSFYAWLVIAAVVAVVTGGSLAGTGVCLATAALTGWDYLYSLRSVTKNE